MSSALTSNELFSSDEEVGRLQRRVNEMYIEDIKQRTCSTSDTSAITGNTVIGCLDTPSVITLNDDAVAIEVGSRTGVKNTAPANQKQAITPAKRRHFVEIDDQVKPRRTKRSGRQGVRRVRRQNNLASLLAMIEDVEEPIIDSLIEPSSSPISELHEDADKMKIWTSFIESSEMDQMTLLKRVDCDEGFSEDYNDDHYEAEMRYNNIDRNIRCLLKKRKLPLGMLGNLECELANFFNCDPSGVLVCKLHSSYERMLTHAVSQYHLLNSQSYNDNNGERRTCIENKYKHYRNADVSLVNYIQKAC